MATILRDFRALAREVDGGGVQIRIQPGDVYWVQNRELEGKAFRFESCGDDSFHPVIVIGVNGQHADVQVLTSNIERYRRRGIIYKPDIGVRLSKPCIILTHRRCRKRQPVSALQQSYYVGNVGAEVLRQIRISESMVA